MLFNRCDGLHRSPLIVYIFMVPFDNLEKSFSSCAGTHSKWCMIIVEADASPRDVKRVTVRKARQFKLRKKIGLEFNIFGLFKIRAFRPSLKLGL